MTVAASSAPVPPLLGQSLSVEALQARLGGLVREREALHAAGRRDDLERNRREIGATQRQIAVTLAALHSATA